MTFSGEDVTGKDAGTYPYGLDDEGVFTNNNDNFDVTFDATDADLIIEPLTAELSWGETGFTYDGEPHVPTATVSKLPDGESCEVTVDGEQTDANPEGKPYTATVTGLSNPNYKLPEEPVTTEFTIAKADLVEDKDFIAPEKVGGLVYNGSEQELITAGQWIGEEMGTFQYRITGYVAKAPAETDFAETIPTGTDAGDYSMEWQILGDKNHNDYSPETIDGEIAQKDISGAEFTFTPSGFNYDGEEHEVTYTIAGPDGEELVKDVDYELLQEETKGTEKGLYTVKIRGIGNYQGEAMGSWAIGGFTIEGDDSVVTGGTTELTLVMDPVLEDAVITWEVDNPNLISVNPAEGESTVVTGIRTGGATVTATITTPDGVYKVTFPISIEYEMFEIGNNMTRLWNPDTQAPGFPSGETLPATGFPTKFELPAPARVRAVNYVGLGMRIQIPVLDVDAELIGVPATETEWRIDQLEDRAGLLSGSAMPGDGYAMIAAHNHLNASEIGPFLMIRELEANDVIFINTPDNELLRFGVYANELLEPDDMEKLAKIAEQESNTLVLVTCENEMTDGGYMNRRVVFAKPL